MIEKIKTVLLVVFSLVIAVLTFGYIKPKKPTETTKETNKKEVETVKAKTNEKIYKDLAGVASSSDPDSAAKSLLDEDYPGSK